MSLEQLSRNQFENIRAAVSKKEKFVTDHLLRMKGDNLNGVLDGVITETEAKCNMLSQNNALRTTILGTGKGSTFNVNELSKEFVEGALELEAVCRMKYKKKSAKYIEAIPQGISEYRKATQAEIPALIKRCRTFTEKYQNELGTDLMIFFKEFEVKWNDENAVKKDIKQESSNAIPELKQIWTSVSKQMQRNCYTILLACPDNPEKLFSYFDFSIVNPHHHHNNNNADEQTYKLLIAANTSKTADISFSPDDSLLIINNGNKPIYYYGATTADAAQPAVLHEITAGDEAEVTALSLGAPANKFLIFVNNETEDIEVEIALI